MPLEGAMNSRASSWLRPWLREQRDAEIKLGFRKCLLTWKHLELDTSKLDPLIEGSTMLAVSQARVAYLSVQLTPWSWPNLLVIVSGFHVILSPRELQEDSRIQVGPSADAATVDSIDPEGAFLREVIENALEMASSRSRLKNLLTESLIKRCQFIFHDTYFQVQCPGESKFCILRSEKISFQPQLNSGTNMRKAISSFLFTSRKESLSISCNAESLEFGMKENGFLKIMLSLTDPFLSLYFKRLKLLGLEFRFPSIGSSLSPGDIPLFLLLSTLFSEQPKSKRGGKLLWKIAAQRVSELTKSSRVTWHKLIHTVMLWLSYVKAYEKLLSVVDYPVKNNLKNHLLQLCCDLEFLKHVKHHLNGVNELEKQLPAEAASRARLIARNRLQLSQQKNISQTTGNSTLRGRIFSLFHLFWKFMCFFLSSVAVFMSFMLKLSPSEFSSSSFKHVSISVQEFSFRLHPVEAAHETSVKNTNIDREIPLSGMPSLCLVLKSFLFCNIRDGFEENLFLVLGGISIQFTPSLNVSLMDDKLELEKTLSFGLYPREGGIGARTILWSEPAGLLQRAVSPVDKKQCKIDVHDITMETLLCELKSIVIIFSEEFQGDEIKCPFFMFELHKKLIFESVLRCITTMGKLNIDLDNESSSLFVRLLVHILHSLQGIADIDKPRSDKLEKSGNSEGEFLLCTTQFKMSLLKLMPLKHIKIGVFLSGCRIKISFHSSRDLNPHGWSSFSTDLSGIEFSVWPASVTKLLELYPGLEVPEPSGDFLWLKELSLLDIPDGHLDKSLNLRGRVSHNTCACLTASASFEYFEENLKSQVIEPISLHIKASTSRQYLHSFYRNENACTLSIHGMTRKTDVFLKMDELGTLFQVLDEITSAQSRIGFDFDCTDVSNSREYIRKLFIMKNDARRAQRTIQPKYEIFPLPRVQFTVDTSIELSPFNLNLGKSRKNNSAMSRTGGASSSNSSSDANWLLSIQKSQIQISCEERNLKLFISFSDIRSDLYQPEFDFNASNEALMENHFVQQSEVLFRFCLPYLIINLSAGRGPDSLSLTTISNLHSLFHFLVAMELGKIILGNHSLKNPLADHQCSGLHVVVSGTEALHDIQFDCQGGCFLLELEKLAFFIETAGEYFVSIPKLQQRTSQSSRKPNDHDEILKISGQEFRKTIRPTLLSELLRWWWFKIIDVNVSHLYVVFANFNASGEKVQYIAIEASFHFRYSSIEEKCSFDVLKLTVLSMHLRDHNQISYSQTQMSCDLQSDARNWSNVRSSTSNLGREISLNDVPCILVPMYQANHIIEDASASVSAEKTALDENVSSRFFSSNWLGNGSVSGFQITISLSEIQMLIDLMAHLSRISSMNTGKISRHAVGLQALGSTNHAKLDIPDGAVVVVKDLHQHLYIATEDIMGSNRVVGTLHYSLVGERALFRVNWEKGKRSLFSLTSLYAKDVTGEPLQLNFSPGSGFVEVSRRGRGYALWKLIPYENEHYEDNDDDEFSKSVMASGKAFYLINYKNDYGITFVDGVCEFVKKPGSAFKVKIFHEQSPVYYAAERSNHGEGYSDIQRRCLAGFNLFDLRVKIEKISVEVFHEIFDADDKVPLARGVVNDMQIIGQVLPSKFRIMCMYIFGMDFFDAQMNNWRQMIPPVDSAVFVHSRHQTKDSEDFSKRATTHYHVKINKVVISMNELFLDILLFIGEKLDITGSYAVRKSMFHSFCEVENLSSLNLICQFGDERDVIVGGTKSTSVILRHAQKIDQSGETRNSVSIRAFKYGGFSTLPLNISLHDYQTFAWRTSILSLKDISSPGPSLGINVSMQTENGLSLSVFPIWRIHNTTGFPLELHLSSQEEGPNFITLLGIGDSLDNFSLLDGSSYSGDFDEAMISLSEGNFMISLRPDILNIMKTGKKVSVDWSENMITGKPISLPGAFDKFSQRVKEAFGVPSVKSSLITLSCPLTAEALCVSHMHFLVQIADRELPLIETSGVRNSKFLLHKEIFISPTFKVFNLLETDIHVVLSETFPDASVMDIGEIGGRAIISHGSNAYFYSNPSSLYFTVSLMMLNSESKPVDISEYVKKLQKQKIQAHFFDIELDFNRGKQSAYLRLSCGKRGILKATVFSSFTLKNSTEFSLFCFSTNQNPLSPEKRESWSLILPPEHGLFLPPNTAGSWLLKSRRVYFRLNEGNASESLLDLDNLSGFTELKFQSTNEAGIGSIVKVGVSLKALDSEDFLPAQLVTISPRYVISNESMAPIFFRQLDLEKDDAGIMRVETKSVATLIMHPCTQKISPTLFESLFKINIPIEENSSVFIQFGLNEGGSNWSGPLCISSLGHFFIKFKKEPTMNSSGGSIDTTKSIMAQFASVNIVEEISTLVLYFHMPPASSLPYRIENFLSEGSITFYQKGTGDPENLRPGDSVDYVWDDQSKPHRLILQISGVQILREINIDKISPWKPFFKSRQNKLLTLHFPANRSSRFQNKDYDLLNGLELRRFGYEVYVDGLTRVLRICELAKSSREETALQPFTSFHFRMNNCSINLLDDGIQEQDAILPQAIITLRFINVALHSLSTHEATHLSANIETINVDNKWQGAPFASMIRRSQLQDSTFNKDMLHFVCIFRSSNPKLKEIKRLSLLLQPFDLNLDEETLMRLASFWRTSLSDSKTQTQLYYFKQFEIHPLKIRTSFLPGNPYSTYSSAQETLRSLLHIIMKVPSVKNTTIQLNGILLNHALLSKKELILKCAQHYSWYVIRAVYVAKGSPLLPPAIASVFDDAASSVLDVFFDPSSGSIGLPGITLGMFKFVNKYVNLKELSGTKRYLGDLSVAMKKAGSSVLFVAVTEISDSILRGAETDGFNGLINGFHQGVLRLALEPTLIGEAVMHGGPDRKIILDQSPGADEMYIEGYLQAMLHVTYNQEYLQVKVIDNVVQLKNLPPNSALIDEITNNVKSFLISQGLLNGDSLASRRPLRHLRGEREWSIGPMLLTLGEHLFVSFAIRLLRTQADKFLAHLPDRKMVAEPSKARGQFTSRIWAVGRFVLSGVFAYVDGWLCRRIPNLIVRRIVSGFLLTFLVKKDKT